MNKKLKFKVWIDVAVKIICCLCFFIVLSIDGNTLGLTLIIKGISIILFLISAILIDKYGRI